MTIVLRAYYLTQELRSDRSNIFFFLLKILWIYFGEGKGGREGEKHQCLVASHTPLLGTWLTTQACALDWELNWGPFGSQVGPQSTEPHQPGQF